MRILYVGFKGSHNPSCQLVSALPGNKLFLTNSIPGLTRDIAEIPNTYDTVYPQILKNVRVADKAAAQNDPDVQAAVAEIAAKLGDSGRILVRESGTEPLVRVMVEAESEAICQEYVDYVIAAIKRKGHCA